MNNDTNRMRAFSDVVSVDAWHQSFIEGRQEVDLKVDVVFTEARLGGESDSPVQFKLKLRRATLAIVTPDTEPVEVIRDSIKRGQDASISEFSTERVDKTEFTGSIEAHATASVLTGVNGSVGGALKAKKEISVVDKEKISGKQNALRTIFRIDNTDDTFTWIIQCGTAEFLEGRAWDANASPLMKLRDRREDPLKGIPPAVRVAVKCLREDLVITDIKLKKEKKFRDKVLGNGEKIKIKAAEAYIRTKLTEIGLEVGDLSSDFAKLVLIDLIAKTER